MKKTIAVLSYVALSVTLFACGGNNNSKGSGNMSGAGSTKSSMTTSSTKSNSIASKTDSAKTGSAPSVDTSNMKLTEMLSDICKDTKVPANDIFDLDRSNFKGYSFIKWIDGIEAAVSEGQITTDAHSLVLIRTNGADAKKMAEEIAEEADPRKWICVGAEVSKVFYTDKYVLMVMTYERAYDGIKTNFEKLMGSDKVTVIDMKKSGKLG